MFTLTVFLCWLRVGCVQEETLRKLFSVYGPGAAKRVPDTSEGETMATSIGMMDPAYLVSEASCRAPDVLFSVLSCPVLGYAVLYMSQRRSNTDKSIQTSEYVKSHGPISLIVTTTPSPFWAGRKEIFYWFNGYLGLSVSKVSSSPWLGKWLYYLF